MNWTTSILSSKHENISVLDYLNVFFIDHWSIKINYLAYFDQCMPAICTYTTVDRVAVAYAITLFISLYGGLVIILRFVASCLIDTVLKLKLPSGDHVQCTDQPVPNRFQPTQSLKRLNLFKNIHDRTESGIHQQRITTRIYLTLLIGKFIFIHNPSFLRSCLTSN